MSFRSLPHDSRLTIHDILQQYWGFDSFRPLQEEIIRSVLNGRDTLAIMPTSGGKSLCYQVPALAKEGMCLVISPLIALMKDQVQNLRKKNITAYSIYSGMSRKEVIHTLKTVIDSNCKFLYVSPERLETDLFKEYLPAMDINLMAVDEAHCISQWGYDFRPPYLRIAALREELPGVPILALTASATPEVQEDICEKLHPPLPTLQRRGLRLRKLKIHLMIGKFFVSLLNGPIFLTVFSMLIPRSIRSLKYLKKFPVPLLFIAKAANEPKRSVNCCICKIFLPIIIMQG